LDSEEKLPCSKNVIAASPRQRTVHKPVVDVVEDEGKGDGWLIFGLNCTPGLRRVCNLWRKEQKLEAPLLRPSQWEKLPWACKYLPKRNHWRSKPKHCDANQAEECGMIEV